MAYKLLEIELSAPLPDIALTSEQDGCGLIARWMGRLVGFQMLPLTPGAQLSAEQLRAIADEKFASAVIAAKLDQALPKPDLATTSPSLSIAICTKDRAARLARLLGALDALAPEPTFSRVEIVVVDNASVDASTREAVGRFPRMRYVFEPKAGLNFARNAAIAAATGDLLAYLDDDVVIDRDWLNGLAEAWLSRPDAGGFTGLVLPYRLDTDAQVCFESNGGFGRGFRRLEHRRTRHGAALHPVGAGVFGAGCNMTFDRRLLVELGGFDEALDTGAPLPGGGDLDIFYRVLRSGRTMVYGPRYAVFHEHRETIPQLRRQYWSWGLGMMAFLVKSWRSDPTLRPLHRSMVRWWFRYQFKALARSLRHLSLRDTRFAIAEIWGGVMGLVGEYDRSQLRIQAIRDAQS
jgi:glycosyltransferase involved in cell wall biosynthesis